MPSPFNQGSPTAPVGAVEVKNSTLICEECWETVGDGLYYESQELLVFTCSSGHKNEVKIRL